jgi:hypothetical protein
MVAARDKTSSGDSCSLKLEDIPERKKNNYWFVLIWIILNMTLVIPSLIHFIFKCLLDQERWILCKWSKQIFIFQRFQT